MRNNEVNPACPCLANAVLELAAPEAAEGEAALHEAIKIDQLPPHPQRALGAIYANRSPGDALRASMAETSTFASSGAQTDLGLILLRLGKDQEALSRFQNVLRIRPQMVRARVGLVRADTPATGSTRRSGVHGGDPLAPQEAAAFNQPGHAYELKGELDQALLDYDQAILLSRLPPRPSTAGIVYRRRVISIEPSRTFDGPSTSVDIRAALAQPMALRARSAAGSRPPSRTATSHCAWNPKSAPRSTARSDVSETRPPDRAIADYDAAFASIKAFAHALYAAGSRSERRAITRERRPISPLRS